MRPEGYEFEKWTVTKVPSFYGTLYRCPVCGSVIPLNYWRDSAGRPLPWDECPVCGVKDTCNIRMETYMDEDGMMVYREAERMTTKAKVDIFSGTSIEFDEKEGPATFKIPEGPDLIFTEDSARMMIQFLQFYLDNRQGGESIDKPRAGSPNRRPRSHRRRYRIAVLRPGVR